MSGTKYNVHSNGSLGIFDTASDANGTYMVEISNTFGTAAEELEVEIMQLKGNQ